MYFTLVCCIDLVQQFASQTVDSRSFAFTRAGDIQCLDIVLANPLQCLCNHIRRNAMVELDDEGRFFQALSEHVVCQCSAIEFPAIDDQSAITVQDIAASMLSVTTVRVTVRNSGIKRATICAGLSDRYDMPAESNRLGDNTGQ